MSDLTQLSDGSVTPAWHPTSDIDAPPVDSITVQQDIGGPYPVYKRVTLDLYADGSVRWRPAEENR